jgi:hypothetical protein
MKNPLRNTELVKKRKVSVIKNWRKVIHNSSHIVFINDKTDYKIRVAVNPMDRYDKNVWEFVILQYGKSKKTIYNLSKSKALAYARAYMRKH